MKTTALVLVLTFAAAACGDDAATPDTSADTLAPDDALDTSDDSSADVGDDTDVADGAIGDATSDAVTTTQGDDVYAPVAPPSEATPAIRAGARWVQHWTEDIEPYWVTDVALGTPVGNYPTFRGMNGALQGSSRRYPRMMGRQIFAYSAGYLMTGDPALLADAAAGVKWLREHAIDRDKGGCFAQLESDGSSVSGVRTSQDLAYCMLGLAAWYYVTRDPAAETDLLAARDLLFSPGGFWDASHSRVIDALDADMTNEVDVENDGGWELVAQLDQINAWMLLTQPVLSTPERRAQWLADLRTLGQTMVDRFFQDDWFWGVSTNKGKFGTKHVDFGHGMKSVWMLRAIDQRLPDHPFAELVARVAPKLLDRAWDEANGRWAKRPTSATAVEYGNDWWQAAEADQLAATLDMAGVSQEARLVETQAHWLSDYVDGKYPVREVIPSVKRDGTPVYGWPPGDTAKCNEWKNGYHSSEHALILSIVGAWREGSEVALHFAVPDAQAADFIATPYIFHGREVGRDNGDLVTTDGVERRAVTVRWTDTW